MQNEKSQTFHSSRLNEISPNQEQIREVFVPYSDQSSASQTQDKEINFRDVFDFIRAYYIKLIIGLMAGAVISAVFALMIRKPSYISIFTIDLDKKTLPSITEPEKIIPEINHILQIPSNIQLLLEALFKNRNSGNSDYQFLVNELIQEQTENIIKQVGRGTSLDLNIDTKKTRVQFKLSQGLQSGTFILSIVLPLPGFKEWLGTHVVEALNNIIAEKNRQEIEIQKNIIDVKNIDVQNVLFDRSKVNNTLRLNEESESLAVRTEMASIEYELFQIVNQIKDKAIPLIGNLNSEFLSRKLLSATQGSIRSYQNEDLDARVERVIQLISVLTIEKKIDQNKVIELHKKVADVHLKFQKLNLNLKSYSEYDSNLFNKINEINTGLVIDRSKMQLPLFKLDKIFYKSLVSSTSDNKKSNLIERKIYDINLMLFVGVGMIIGIFAAICLIILLNECQREGVAPNQTGTPS